MSDKRQGVMGSLPSTRPHRRSDRRPAADAASPDAGESAAGGKPAAAAKKPAATRKPAAAKKPAAAAKAKARKPTPGDGNVARRSPSDRPRAQTTGGRPAAKKPPANVRRRATATPPPTATASPAAAEAPSRRAPAHEPSPTPDRPGTVETLVQAAAELTEIGLRVSARAVRGAVSRLPRP